MRARAASGDAAPDLGARQGRRLREVWRSAGWPCRDTLELDLLADLRRGIADADELPFALWMALARANAEQAHDDEALFTVGCCRSRT